MTAQRFYVLDKAAKMPSSCKWGGYRKVAVVEAAVPGECPVTIDARRADVARVVCVWDRLSGGRSDGTRTAYARALAEAEKMAARLNDEAASAEEAGGGAE